MKKLSFQYLYCVFGCALLMFTCAACNSINKAHVPFTMKSTPVETHILSQPTSTHLTGSHTPPDFTLYTGRDGYTIAVPTAWDIIPLGDIHTINFAYEDNSHDDEFYVDVLLNVHTHPSSSTSLRTIANNYINDYLHTYPYRGLPPGYHILNVASTRKVNGVLWNQVVVESDIGASAVKTRLVCLVTRYATKRMSNKLVVLFYFAALKDFEKVSTSVFEPMVQSFTFTPPQTR
jgi:hypothetical protein